MIHFSHSAIVLLLLYVSSVCGDLYMHNPRGSNNRLNEKSATRAQNHRIFDSHNNARGGYNVGDKTSEPAGAFLSKWVIRGQPVDLGMEKSARLWGSRGHGPSKAKLQPRDSVHVRGFCQQYTRYNISTDDYDPYKTKSQLYQEGNVQSPVQDNIQIDVGGKSKLQIAFSTDQTGRVFQDRSHVFNLVRRPAGLDHVRIYNLNTRGKRGNFVQTYPAVEYDFTPNYLRITDRDLVHIQWAGSNTHNNGEPGGDGDTGDDGEGITCTDIINIAQIGDRNDNLPLTFERSTMWNNADIVWTHHLKTDISPKDLVLEMASSGFYRCFKKASCPDAAHKDYIVETKTTPLQNQLNNAPASYQGGLLRFKKGTYHYMCTRNNNFTNRSNKGTIIVS